MSVCLESNVVLANQVSTAVTVPATITEENVAATTSVSTISTTAAGTTETEEVTSNEATSTTAIVGTSTISSSPTTVTVIQTNNEQIEAANSLRKLSSNPTNVALTKTSLITVLNTPIVKTVCVGPVSSNQFTVVKAPIPSQHQQQTFTMPVTVVKSVSALPLSSSSLASLAAAAAAATTTTTTTTTTTKTDNSANISTIPAGAAVIESRGHNVFVKNTNCVVEDVPQSHKLLTANNFPANNVLSTITPTTPKTINGQRNKFKLVNSVVVPSVTTNQSNLLINKTNNNTQRYNTTGRQQKLIGTTTTTSATKYLNKSQQQQPQLTTSNLIKTNLNTTTIKQQASQQRLVYPTHKSHIKTISPVNNYMHKTQSGGGGGGGGGIKTLPPQQQQQQQQIKNIPGQIQRTGSGLRTIPPQRPQKLPNKPNYIGKHAVQAQKLRQTHNNKLKNTTKANIYNNYHHHQSPVMATDKQLTFNQALTAEILETLANNNKNCGIGSNSSSSSSGVGNNTVSGGNSYLSSTKNYEILPPRYDNYNFQDNNIKTNFQNDHHLLQQQQQQQQQHNNNDNNKSGLDTLSLICQAVLLDHNYNATLPPDSPTITTTTAATGIRTNNSIQSLQLNGIPSGSLYSPGNGKRRNLSSSTNTVSSTSNLTTIQMNLQDDDAASDISDCSDRKHDTEGEETDTAPEAEAVNNEDQFDHYGDYVTRCICGFLHDDGYMIECDRCKVWQHVQCVVKNKQVPEEYLCEVCDPSKIIDRHKARLIQQQWLRDRQFIDPKLRKETKLKDVYNKHHNNKDNISDSDTSDGEQQQQQHTGGHHNNNIITKGRPNLVNRRKNEQHQKQTNSNSNNNNSLSSSSSSSAAATTTTTTTTTRQRRDSAKEVVQRRQIKKRERKVVRRKTKAQIKNHQQQQQQHNNNSEDENQDTILQTTTTTIGNNNITNNTNTPLPQLRHWIENYEEAVTNHYSPELRARISSIRVNGAHSDTTLQIDNLVQKCRVHTQPLTEIKYLISTIYLPPNTPVVELRGKYMLSTQHRNTNSNLNTRQHAQRPGPFLFFYRLHKDNTEVCVDTRTYGNSGRFIRRSCKPNAELRHCIEKGVLHLYIVTITNVEKNIELTIKHESHDLAAIGTTHISCACGCIEECTVNRNIINNNNNNNKKNGENNEILRKRRGRRTISINNTQIDNNNIMMMETQTKINKDEIIIGQSSSSSSQLLLLQSTSDVIKQEIVTKIKTEDDIKNDCDEIKAATTITANVMTTTVTAIKDEIIKNEKLEMIKSEEKHVIDVAIEGDEIVKKSSLPPPVVAATAAAATTTTTSAVPLTKVIGTRRTSQQQQQQQQHHHHHHQRLEKDEIKEVEAKEDNKNKNKKLSREERKLEAILRAIAQMEKADQKKQEHQAKQAHRRESEPTTGVMKEEDKVEPKIKRKRRKGRTRASSTHTQINRRNRLNSTDSYLTSGDETLLSPNDNGATNHILMKENNSSNSGIGGGGGGGGGGVACDEQNSPDKAAGLLLALSNGDNIMNNKNNDIIKSPTREIIDSNSNSAQSSPETHLSSACLLVQAAVEPMEPGFKFPKTKKGLMNEWLNKVPEPIQSASSISPSSLTPHINNNNNSNQDYDTNFYNTTTSSSSSSSNKSLVALAQVASFCDTTTNLHHPRGNAKKRWLRQAISEDHQCDSPLGRPETPPLSETVAPPKKRRLPRESISNDITPPTTPTSLVSSNNDRQEIREGCVEIIYSGVDDDDSPTQTMEPDAVLEERAAEMKEEFGGKCLPLQIQQQEQQIIRPEITATTIGGCLMDPRLSREHHHHHHHHHHNSSSSSHHNLFTNSDHLVGTVEKTLSIFGFEDRKPEPIKRKLSITEYRQRKKLNINDKTVEEQISTEENNSSESFKPSRSRSDSTSSCTSLTSSDDDVAPIEMTGKAPSAFNSEPTELERQREMTSLRLKKAFGISVEEPKKPALETILNCELPPVIRTNLLPSPNFPIPGSCDLNVCSTSSSSSPKQQLSTLSPRIIDGNNQTSTTTTTSPVINNRDSDEHCNKTITSELLLEQKQQTIEENVIDLKKSNLFYTPDEEEEEEEEDEANGDEEVEGEGKEGIEEEEEEEVEEEEEEDEEVGGGNNTDVNFEDTVDYVPPFNNPIYPNDNNFTTYTSVIDDEGRYEGRNPSPPPDLETAGNFPNQQQT